MSGPRRPQHLITQDFFAPRLVHFRSHYQQTPGLVLSDWRVPKLSWQQKLLRILTYKIRQGSPSQLGLSKLPYEIMDMIFRHLCGREIDSVRLVCTEWELTSRPFFADQHLKRSLFWLTGSDLARLERLASKFGPYMEHVDITTDCFSLAGLSQMWRNYVVHKRHIRRLSQSTARPRNHRYSSTQQPSDETSQPLLQLPRGGPLQNPSSPSNAYFRHAYRQLQPLSPWTHLHHWCLFWTYTRNILSQLYLRITGFDRHRLARIKAMLPRARLEAVKPSYAAEELNHNREVYGWAAPGFALELGLLCGGGGGGLVFGDDEYEGHVVRVVAKTMLDSMPCVTLEEGVADM